LIHPAFLYRVYSTIILLWLVPVTGCSQDNHTSAAGFDAVVRPWYKYRADGKAGREITLVLKGIQLQPLFTVTIECEGKTELISFSHRAPGDSVSILLPAGAGVQKEAQARITLRAGEQEWRQSLMVPVKKQWTVYIYPHAHVDIGYTALQETVEKLHIRNIDVGIDIARKTQHYPRGARFVWNPEAAWVVTRYWQQASVQQKQHFIEAVQKGWVQIDAAHSNINTSTCSDEELMNLFAGGNRMAAITGVPVTTMVQMDVPGGSWGIVQAAAQHGIKGFISFPNYYDLRYTWENKPFYWLGPDGKSKLFFLQAISYGAGYKIKGSKYGLGKIQHFSDAYDRLSTGTPLVNFIDPFIFDETARLEAARSPYDIFAMTWSMADNCLIDADLPEAVRQWNERYAYPKLIIAGARDIVAAYEKKYSAMLPVYKGDFTEFWTEGLGSDARRVAMSRRAKENLVQAAALWPMLNRAAPVPHNNFEACRENLLLAAEHTWGYQDPALPVAQKVEATKAGYFENAEKISHALIAQALQPIVTTGSSSFAVINTLSWPRGGLITLSAEQSKAGNKVVDENNTAVLCQRLSTGELVFEAQNIPALGSRLYKLIPGGHAVQPDMTAGASTIQNEQLCVVIDEQTGHIKSCIDKINNRQLVDTVSIFGLNSYYHLPGVYNGKDTPGKLTTTSDVSIRIKENGPLVVSVLVSSKAAGCNWLTREVKLVKDQPVVELLNTFDKTVTRNKEGIHVGFAFNIPSGNTRIDIPWGIMMPEYDQLPGANKNWMAFQRWIDISNTDYGITWTAIDAPVVELGGITGNILDGARQAYRWIKKLSPAQTIVSWPVNNHWDTNFPLQQSGVITCTYKILVHGKYNVVNAARFGMEQHRPLMVVPAAVNPVKKAIISISNPKVMIAALQKSIDERATIIRLRSVSGQPETVTLNWPAANPKGVFYCMANEKALQKTGPAIRLLPYGVTTLRVIW
jgi:alpha-mannosidase